MAEDCPFHTKLICSTHERTVLHRCKSALYTAKAPQYGVSISSLGKPNANGYPTVIKLSEHELAPGEMCQACE